MATPLGDSSGSPGDAEPIRSRLALCGPDRLTRAALAEALAGEPDLDILAAKRSAGNLLAELQEVAPDCVIVVGGDRHLRAEVLATFPDARVVSVGGAAAIPPVPDGRLRHLDAATARVDDVAAAVRTSTARPAAVAAIEVPPGQRGATLSEREIRLIKLSAEGLTAEEIGGRLGISSRSVAETRKRAYAKLGVASQAHAIATAVREGLVTTGQPQPRSGI